MKTTILYLLLIFALLSCKSEVHTLTKVNNAIIWKQNSSNNMNTIILNKDTLELSKPNTNVIEGIANNISKKSNKEKRFTKFKKQNNELINKKLIKNSPLEIKKDLNVKDGWNMIGYLWMGLCFFTCFVLLFFGIPFSLVFHKYVLSIIFGVLFLISAILFYLLIS